MMTQSLTSKQDKILTKFENIAGEILDQYTIDDILEIISELDTMVVDGKEEIEHLENQCDELKDELADANKRIDDLVYELENFA